MPGKEIDKKDTKQRAVRPPVLVDKYLLMLPFFSMKALSHLIGSIK